MFNRYQKLVAVILTASALLLSCSQTESSSNKEVSDTVPDSVTEETSETTAESWHANIPEGTDLDGYAFRVMVNDSSQYWVDINFTHDDENGNYINDSVYRRERSVEELLGCDIVTMPIQDVAATTTRFVSTNDDAADMVWIAPVRANGLVTDGCFIELNTINSLDLSNPWWDSNAAAGLSIAGKLYMMYGDISMMYKRTMSVCLFNKVIISSLNLESPYNFVDRNEWTFDTLAALSKDVSQDLNNDGVFKIREDRLAAGMTPDQLPIMLIGCESPIVTKDADDIPQLTFYNERMVSVFDKITTYLFDESTVAISDSGSTTDSFGESKLLFQFCEMHCIPKQRNMDDDFGILPFPKYEPDQERYYHVINPNVACAMLIPVTVADPERCGLVAEVLGAEGKNLITPAYYDFNLTSRDTRDEESVAMLDIIFATTKYDVAHIYDLGGIGSQLRDVASKKDTNITSLYEKRAKGIQKAIDKAVQAYEKIDE